MNTGIETNIDVSDYAGEIAAFYVKFLKEIRLNPSFYDMDVVVLKTVVRRYAYDVERLHHYHNMDLIDCHKIAGYLTYWICRLRPVQVADRKTVYQGKTDDSRFVGIAKKSFFINELFSIFLGISRINLHYKKNGVNKEVALNKDFVNALTYNLKYRFVTGDMLSLIYYMIDTSCSKDIVP